MKTIGPLSLSDQLLKNIKSGLEITVNSLLPKGCGLGGSSILAAAIVMVMSFLISSQSAMRLELSVVSILWHTQC